MQPTRPRAALPPKPCGRPARQSRAPHASNPFRYGTYRSGRPSRGSSVIAQRTDLRTCDPKVTSLPTGCGRKSCTVVAKPQVNRSRTKRATTTSARSWTTRRSRTTARVVQRPDNGKRPLPRFDSERTSDLVFRWWRGQDLNLRPSGYEPDELPNCSTPRRSRSQTIRRSAGDRNRLGLRRASPHQDDEPFASASTRRWISSVVRSSPSWLMIQRWPNGSRNRPSRRP